MASDLTPEHRNKLANIVSQMEANQESEANIRLAVEHYKTKYGGMAVPVDQQPAGMMDTPIGMYGIKPSTVLSGAKAVGKFAMEQGPKALGAAIGGTLGAPLGPAGIIGGAGLGAAGVGAVEDILHQTVGGQPRSTVGQAITNRLQDVAGGAMQEAAPALKIQGSLGPAVTKDVESDLIRAIKPINRKTEFRTTLQRAVPDVSVSAKGEPIQSLEQLEPLIQDAKRRVWAEYADLLKNPRTAAEQLRAKAKDRLMQAGQEPNKNVQAMLKGEAGQALKEGHDVLTIDGNKIADAMESVITKRFELQNPAKAEAIRQTASTYRRSIPVDEAEDFLQGANNDLSAYYKKNKVDRMTAERDPDWGHVVKEAETLRKEIYTKLDELDKTLGTPAAELKRRYGALQSTLEEVLRRKNVAGRQSPYSLAEQISMARAAGNAGKAVLTGDPVAGLKAVAEPAAAMYLKHRNTTDELIKRAFAEFQKGSETPNTELLRLLPALTRQGGAGQ